MQKDKQRLVGNFYLVQIHRQFKSRGVSCYQSLP